MRLVKHKVTRFITHRFVLKRDFTPNDDSSLADRAKSCLSHPLHTRLNLFKPKSSRSYRIARVILSANHALDQQQNRHPILPPRPIPYDRVRTGAHRDDVRLSSWLITLPLFHSQTTSRSGHGTHRFRQGLVRFAIVKENDNPKK